MPAPQLATILEADMVPLVVVLLFAFFFVIALSLVVWAALTLGAERSPVVTVVSERASKAEKKVRKSEPRERQRLTPRESHEQFSEPMAEERQAVRQGTLWDDPQVSSGDGRPADRPGAEARKNRATVTPRESTGDAFERFLQNEERRR